MVNRLSICLEFYIWKAPCYLVLNGSTPKLDFPWGVLGDFIAEMDNLYKERGKGGKNGF